MLLLQELKIILQERIIIVIKTAHLHVLTLQVLQEDHLVAKQEDIVAVEILVAQTVLEAEDHRVVVEDKKSKQKCYIMM
jgi:hypothetical protein